MELIHPATEGQQRLVNVVDEMVIASGQPRPKLYLVPDDDPNAFATGRDPGHASLAVTDGLLTLLDRDELQAVVAHEMGHITRYDTQLLTLVVLVLWLVTLLLAPLLSRLMAMAISRKREFLADATAAQYTRNPSALASALAKRDNARTPTRAVGRGAAHRCIVDPGDGRFSRLSGVVGNLLASHPPIEERIARLRGMAFEQEDR